MGTPTTVQLRAAIQVLKKLEERIGSHAKHSTRQLPATPLGEEYSARIKSQTSEQIADIKTVMTQLENWRDELKQQRGQCVSHRV
jgi:glutamine synthetase adenylyltransferase